MDGIAGGEFFALLIFFEWSIVIRGACCWQYYWWVAIHLLIAWRQILCKQYLAQ
ncbi:hypothetical protein K450DRAFT_217991 [Umbelopsis ramanniana AG]|uniref:Uncharacterized protein n=1 Tax=Umbelopsis ramanniana AG TaxID=1314678 RepID=A0AAD5EJ49_UMBRA|nr:uncharacterized protein K450DRAFT_217991 [Umbelopsis ramanniana AG]KAI8584781.1 hypothetical protein K450DRAFT_217991 [Umbelopsis ramanniana AG]